MKPLIILDNGHGRDTPGKRSPVWPDGTQLFEFRFNRDIVRRIALELEWNRIDYHILVPEESDISLTERCRRANELYKERDCILLSIHANAGGGTGYESFTSKGYTMSDEYATILCMQMQEDFPEWKMRFDYSDGDPDKESQFAILVNSKCPAILSENFFMDTEKDCRFIQSEMGRIRIAKSHVFAIKKMLLFSEIKTKAV